MTYAEIAKELDIPDWKVRDIERSAFRKIKNNFPNLMYEDIFPEVKNHDYDLYNF